MTDLSTQPVLLEMVNTVLEETGYGVVHTLDNTPIVESVLQHLHVIKKTFLYNGGEGWTFNVMDIDLVPDSNGEVLIPRTILGILSDNPYLYIRKGRLYVSKSNSTTELGVDTASVITNLDYEDLSPTAQQYVAYAAAHRLAVADAFSDAELNRLFQMAEQFMLQIGNEEIGRMAKEDDGPLFSNAQEYSYLTRRMLNTQQ